jgi:hypothetical protein
MGTQTIQPATSLSVGLASFPEAMKAFVPIYIMRFVSEVAFVTGYVFDYQPLNNIGMLGN